MLTDMRTAWQTTQRPRLSTSEADSVLFRQNDSHLSAFISSGVSVECGAVECLPPSLFHWTHLPQGRSDSPEERIHSLANPPAWPLKERTLLLLLWLLVVELSFFGCCHWFYFCLFMLVLVTVFLAKLLFLRPNEVVFQVCSVVTNLR